MKKITFLIICLLMLFQLSEAFSQTPQYTYNNGATGGNAIPLGGGTWANQRGQWLYLPGDFGTTVPGGMAISKIYVRASGTYPQSTYTDFEVSLGQNANTTALTTVWETGLTNVLDEPSFTAGPTVADQWIEIELETPFAYDPTLPLIVETIQTATSGGIALRAGGTPVNPIYTGNTQNYGASTAATPTSRRYSYQFGFDLVSLVPNNAGVLSIDSPTVFCAGTKDIYATIGNFGINQIDSLMVHWTFNGNVRPDINYTQLLDTINGAASHLATIYLGTENFPYGIPNAIKVWVSDPNGTTDTVNVNDTLEIVKQAALTGSYTIDAGLPGSSGNYQSFSALANDLNAFGVCGPVYVTVAAGFYQDYFHLENVPGTSAINTITIDGQDSSTTTLSHDASASYATVTLNGADHVTIKNMRIEATGSSKGVSVLLSSGANYNMITNNELYVSTTSTSSNFINVLYSGSASSNASGAEANYNTISNNKIDGGYYGIRMYASSANLNVGNRILNNELTNQYYYGIYSYYQDSVEVIGNTLDVTSRNNANSYGAYMYYSFNALVEDNFIHAGSYGVYMYTYTNYAAYGRRSTLNNNMIISDGNYGVYMYYMDTVNVLQNSISTMDPASPAMMIGASTTRGIGGYDVRNNIFSSVYGPALSTNVPDAMFQTFDYNLYHSKGNVLLTIDNTDYSTLAAYQSASPSFNMNSLQGDPQFVDPSGDLHILGALANDVGDNSVGITYDLDGDTRPMPGSTIVDIGADEYDAPSCPPPYGLTAYEPRLDSITLEWEGGIGGTFQVEIVYAGNGPGTGDTINSLTDSIRIGDLDTATGYEYYVRQVCARGDSSIWWGPYEFFTAGSIVYSEDFESFDNGELTNGWESSTYVDPYWVSGTSATYDGPVEDHTIGAGGTFAYLSTGYAAGTSILSTPYIYVDTNKHMELSFWYHMFGADMGTMNVYIDSNGVSNLITSISGQQQVTANDPWLEFSTYLTGYEGQYVRILFEALKGTGYYSSMAIDDVRIDTVTSFNVSVVEWIAPQGVICPGTITPVVGVRNTGTTAIDSVEVFWEINGAAVMGSVMYNNTIASGDTAAVTLGNMTFAGNNLYDLKFYTHMPNSLPDPITIDDTLKLDNWRTGLNRSYTIDPVSLPTATNFNSFNEAADALNNFGVCGAVDFTVSPGNYAESLTLFEIGGSSSTNTVIFDGQDSSQVNLNHDGSLTYGTLTLDGADHVTFKNMTIESTANSNTASVLFANDANHNTISNNELKVLTSTSSSTVINVLFSGSTSSNTSGAIANYNTISNNKIDGGYYGIRMYASSSDINVYNRILNNELSNQYYYGMYAYYQDSLDIVGNSIDMTMRNNVNADGLYIYYSNNTLLSENHIISNDYGVYMYNYSTYTPTTRKIEVSNNMISSNADYGLYLYYVEEVNLYHNSINVEGSSPAVRIYSTTSRPLSNYDFRNNIFSAENAAAIESEYPSTMFTFMDNNAYYSRGSNLLAMDGTNYSDLASFQAAMPALNVNSIEGDPQFESLTDLHIVGNFVNDKGDNAVGIGVDIDGDTRPMTGSTIVDIGADEFDPPSCPPVININALNATATTIDLQWEGGTGHFDYEIVLKGDPQGSGVIRDTTLLDSLTVGGLNPLTEYDYYVREFCGRGDTSIWWGPITFETIDLINDLAIDAYTAPANRLNSCFTNTEDIELLLINSGNVPVDFSVDTLQLTVNVSGAAIQSFNLELNDNSLNAGAPLAIGDSLLVPMGTLDMTTIGDYHFEAIQVRDKDGVASNDTLRSTVSNSTSGGTLSAGGNICGSGTVSLQAAGAVGEVQWQRMVNGVFTDELAADSISYEVFIDSATTFRMVACGIAYSDTLTITPLAIPAMPVVLDDTAIVFCGDSGTAVPSATSSVSGTINWYDDSSSTSVISTGSTFNYGLNTSAQSATTVYSDTFYVSVVDGTTNCESEKALVTAAVICTVGEKELQSHSFSIAVQPNPSEGHFNLIGNNLEEEMQVLIYNSNGKIVYQLNSKVSEDFNEEIDLSGFSNGIYFIKLQGNESVKMLKVMIQ